MSLNAENCSLCGQTVHLITASAPGYQCGKKYAIFECEGCLASFASPLTADDSLYSLIYDNIQHVPGYNRYFNYAHDVLKQKNPLAYLNSQEESYWAVAQHVTAKRSAGEELRILEVGCGMGYFSYALHQAGFDVTGIDLSETAVAWSREHYGPFYERTTLQTLHESGRKYDIIIMNQLIEHIADVHQFIAESLALLTPQGELLLTTPDKSAYPGAEWETELPPVHLWWFGEQAMKYIARHHSCKITFTDFTNFYDSNTRVKTSGTPLVSRKAVFDEQGRLIVNQTIPSCSPWVHLLERVGLLDMFRRAKIKIQQNYRWQGPGGPICSCVLQPLQGTNE